MNARRRRSARRRRGRRGTAWVVIRAGAIVAIPAAGLLLAAWRDVAAARHGVAAVSGLLRPDIAASVETSEGRAALLGRLDQVRSAVAAAHQRLLRSRPLSLVGALPGGATVRAQALDLLDDGGRAASATRSLVVAIDASMADANVRDGQIPMATLVRVRTSVEQARDALRSLAHRSGGRWTPVRPLRHRFDRGLTSLAGHLDSLAGGLRAAASFFGAAGDRRYLLAFGNNAEMRDGGMVLSYGVLDVSSGRFALTRTGSIADLTLTAPTSTPLPPGTAAVFGPLHPTQTWQSVNATADFALSGRIMADMYRQATGVPVDGVVGVDVPALAGLLAVIGPVTAAGIAEPVTATNAATVLLHDQYAGIPPLADTSARRDRLADVSRAVFDRLGAGGYDAILMAQAVAAAGAGRHLQLWSTDEVEERFYEHVGLGGGPAVTAPDRTFHIAVENRTATKLDYFVHPSVRQTIRVTSDGDAVVSTRVHIENRAPTGAAPSYQLGPDRFTQTPGDYVGSVLMWSPAGTTSEEQGPFRVESSLQVAERVVMVKAGEGADVTFPPVTIKGAVRNGHIDLRFVPQPRLEPTELHVTVAARGRGTAGGWEFVGAWDHTLGLSWKVN